MAVQISKKRKVRPWGPGPGNCGAARVGACGEAVAIPAAPCPAPGSGLGRVAFPQAADGGGLNAGPEPGERSLAAGRSESFLPLLGEEQR